ncbi:MAG: NAD-dependent deacylase [Candidatus Omnitrophota bacterium]
MNRDGSAIAKIAGLLKNSKSILFITGAGISADSGLPTYRGVGGLYNDKATEEGISVEMALAGETLREHPEVTWKYLLQIERNCRRATFNRGHKVIAEMERHFERVWVLTQNIDGLHRTAGSRNIIDIHGDMHSLICPSCGWHDSLEDYSNLDILPPHCPQCRGVVRPDVVFFGEMLPQEKLTVLMRQLREGFDIYFSIGTSSVFPYISQPIIAAAHLGRPTVEINPGSSDVSDIVSIKLSMGAAEALDLIWEDYNKGGGNGKQSHRGWERDSLGHRHTAPSGSGF